MFRSTAISMVLLVTALGAHATQQRSFVSAGTGSDANPCTRSSPCRNFTTAIFATDPGGEVIVLDSGGYGSFLVEKSISIVAPDGVYAGVTALAAGTAITANAPIGSDVDLRGLTVNSLGGTVGILFSDGTDLRLDRCLVRGFSDSGVQMARVDVNTFTLFVTSSTFSNNQTGAYLKASGAGGLAVITFDNVKIEGSTLTGMSLIDNIQATIANSNISLNPTGVDVSASPSTAAKVAIDATTFHRNSTYGVRAGNGIFSGGTDAVSISRSLFTNTTGTGIACQTNGTCYVANTTLFGNVLGVSGATTGGGNHLYGNTTDGTFVGMIPPQ